MKTDFSNIPALTAAMHRAAVNLVPPEHSEAVADTPAQRAAEAREAILLLDQAMRACVRAGRMDAADLAGNAQATLAGVA
jgi:hypothetical protein